MIKTPTRDQTLALAGVFQACHLVDVLARTGQVATDNLATALNSLLEQDPSSTEALFGGIANLAVGITAMDEQLTRKKLPSNCLRYVIGVLQLERKLHRNPAMMAQIVAGIGEAHTQAAYFSPTHDNVIARLAGLYQQTISTLDLRIQVNGDGGYLQQPAIVNRVRCLLFAGIRAGIHWHHLGGRRWHLILLRKPLLAQLKQLQTQLERRQSSTASPAPPLNPLPPGNDP
ncbi:MAG: high frequency lysogenization protein HflD [Porticoccaceae bacterium]